MAKESLHDDIRQIMRNAMFLLKRVEQKKATHSEIVHILKKIIELTQKEEEEETKIVKQLEEVEKDLAEGKDPFDVLDKIIDRA